jgi:hypothetical protein
MKKQLLILVSISLCIACSSIKSTQKAINSGNYDIAINLAVENLKSNKTKKKNQPYVFMLEEAFSKASDRDQEKITFLQKDANPENLESIYNLYVTLKKRQEKIKPLLPLAILKNNTTAKFSFENYNTDIINSKNNLTNHLYTKATSLFNSNDKYDYRKAYDDLSYIEKINPNFKDTRSLMEEAIVAGRDFVFVSMKNETEKVIPKRLEQDLLNFDTYGLNDLWTVYHSTKDAKIRYDFGLELNLRNIDVSPEQVREKEIIKERSVKDGFKFLLDKDGNQVLDKEGKKIKVDNLVNVSCELYQFTQFKLAKVKGQVKYVDLYSNQVIETYPIASEFTFQHIYANYRGDKRALESSFLDLIRLRVVPFPSNEQMIYDTGSDLKQKLKYIITRNKFRN